MPESALLAPPTATLGRPSTYTEEAGQRVLDALYAGTPIRRFRERDDLPDPMTVYRWEESFPAFRERLAGARKALADHYAFTGLERLEAVDPDSEYGSQRVSKARDTAGHMRWLASCLDPATYGDRLKVDADVKVAVVACFVDARPAAAAGAGGRSVLPVVPVRDVADDEGAA